MFVCYFIIDNLAVISKKFKSLKKCSATLFMHLPTKINNSDVNLCFYAMIDV